jgi:glycosyltransferase involved in cell wall biosynthesis
MDLAISFTNLGPYHLARLRAAAIRLAEYGGRLIAYETAAVERLYPWQVGHREEPFRKVVLFPDRALEDLSANDCAMAMEEALDRDQPDVVAAAGYVRPEALASARWARKTGARSILLSESQEVDRPRQWWKEAVKRRRVRLFDAAMVGGASHRAYLELLGMPTDRIALGYNAVDNVSFAARAQAARRSPDGRLGLPDRPYFLSVCRFAREKNLPTLIDAYAMYRRSVGAGMAWDLVLCGSGPEANEVEAAISRNGLGESIRRPGFLQADQLGPWYAFASAFVLASRSEPWGLVVNEAAACGLPLLVSDRAGASGTLVPDPPGSTGLRFDPTRPEAISDAMAWIAAQPSDQRKAMGRRAAALVADWGPERFASGLMEAVDRASAAPRHRRLARAS